MSQTNDNILYIPIQINGGENKYAADLKGLLKERELYINSEGILYVGIKKEGKVEVWTVAGRVHNNATITNPTIKQYLNVGTSSEDGDKIIVTKAEFDANKNTSDFKMPGRIFFVDEGKGYT